MPDKIKIMVPKATTSCERKLYFGCNVLILTKGDTYDYAITDNADVIRRVTNCKHEYVYEVVTT